MHCTDCTYLSCYHPDALSGSCVCSHVRTFRNIVVIFFWKKVSGLKLRSSTSKTTELSVWICNFALFCFFPCSLRRFRKILHEKKFKTQPIYSGNMHVLPKTSLNLEPWNCIVPMPAKLVSNYKGNQLAQCLFSVSEKCFQVHCLFWLKFVSHFDKANFHNSWQPLSIWNAL